MADVVHRIEVFPKPGISDPIAESLQRDARSLGIRVGSARTAHVYLFQGALTPVDLASLCSRVLVDPVTETAHIGSSATPDHAQTIEVHPLPGVMDPVAQSVGSAALQIVGKPVQVSTGWRYDLGGITSEQADLLASRLLANPVIQRVHRAPYHPGAFPVGRSHDHAVRQIPVINLSDDELTRLSREAHLFLSLDEMRAIRDQYRALGREPRDIELETLAQTWSEHCVHKTLKSTITYRRDPAEADDPISWSGRPGHAVNADGSITINNLLKSTVAAATHELIKDGVDWTLSIFVDNSGVIAFDDDTAVCIKVETHNHPSAIEPYGGAATGIGGCIRDVIGTGLGARPIASTDVFCVAMPGDWSEAAGRGEGEGERAGTQPLPPGCLHPRRILTQVVAGVRDYGNRMGIPTVAGGVYFDSRYVGNPLVYCGCIGVMPRNRIKGKVHSGDLIVALGGRTGRDGIHGATFSSAELEQSSADEFSHAVQIGNAIEEKRLLDAIMRARDEDADGPLFSGLTDCGAGGFSSAVGEMGKQTGATVHLDRAPLKYAGLSYTEIWISEAQERMVLAVPPAKLESLRRICEEESVELAVLGTFGHEAPDVRRPALGAGSNGAHGASSPELVLVFHGREVGRLSMEFLHEGIPTPTREAAWSGSRGRTESAGGASAGVPGTEVSSILLSLLSHPNIASKHWIVRQYDHEVRGNTLIKPLVGPLGIGPSDAAVVQPVPGSTRGLAISQGLQTGMGDAQIGGDPYLMALGAVDECVRNLVCVGADPDRIAILDNFCWPSCAKPANLGSLVRAAEGCYDAAKAYRTPFVSGKDSLNNQFTIPARAGKPARTIEIPPTLLITGMGIVPDVGRCVTSDAKKPGSIVLLAGPAAGASLLMGGSHAARLVGAEGSGSAGVPRTDLTVGPAVARAVSSLIREGVVLSAHDVSDGGALVALAEMLIAGSSPAAPIGAELAAVPGDRLSWFFSEAPSRYLLEVDARNVGRCTRVLSGLGCTPLATLNSSGVLTGEGLRITTEELTTAWRGTLDW
ncbi:MAG: AIR synthase-related protein [Phycisphaerales bacterium]